MKQNRLLLVSSIILAAAIIFVGQQMDGSAAGTVTDTISVAGEGTTSIAPDSMLINVSVTELANSTDAAQKVVNTKVTQLLTILDTFAVAKEKIKTENVSVYPEYQWTESANKMIGYRASQMISIRVVGDDYVARWGQILDEIAGIWGVTVNNTSFVVDDMDAALLEARAEAFENAQTKAQQLAELAGLRLGKATIITDQSVSNYPVPPIYYARDMAVGMGWPESANLNPGESDITVHLQVVFELK